jgi:hypothetical protein
MGDEAHHARQRRQTILAHREKSCADAVLSPWPETDWSITDRRGQTEHMGAAKKKCIRCEDCYFKQNMLCALNLDAPCPTYRPAERGLRPEKQLAFVFRMDRTQAAYAFPQPQGRW